MVAARAGVGVKNSSVKCYQAAVGQRLVVLPEHGEHPLKAAAHVFFGHVMAALRHALGDTAQAQFRRIQKHQNDRTASRQQLYGPWDVGAGRWPAS